MIAPLVESALPLPLFRRGKVRDVYGVGDERLFIVASDRVSAFDVVMAEPVPDKGRVLTQISAFWFDRLAPLGPTHLITADIDDILDELPDLIAFRDELHGRAMLVRRCEPVPFECVVRGYLAGSAWKEYHEFGTLAGERLPDGLQQSDRFDPPRFSPATKNSTGHDENVPFAEMAASLPPQLAEILRERSLALYAAGRDIAASRDLIIADTKFEFGVDPDGTVRLIDEVFTPDSSRFWRSDAYRRGTSPSSLDKQPLRDWLAGERSAGRWDGNAPPPRLPADVIAATAARYREAYSCITGQELEATN